IIGIENLFYGIDVQNWNVFYIKSMSGCTLQNSHSALSSELDVLLEKLPSISKKYAKAVSIRNSLKEKINCVSIHAVANAAVNKFTSAESSQINKMADSDDKDHFALAEPGQRNEMANSNDEDHFTLAEPGQRNKVVDSDNKEHFTSAEPGQRNETADSNVKDYFTSAELANDKGYFIPAGLKDYSQRNEAADSDFFISAGLEDYGQRNEVADSNNEILLLSILDLHFIKLWSDGLETRKHSLVLDEEPISINRRQMGIKSSNANVKPVNKNKYILEWNFEENTRPLISEWIIDEVNISTSFFNLREHAISMVNKCELTYSNHPGKMLSVLALNSILLLEENSIRTQLNIPSNIWKKAFKQIKDKENTRLDLEDSIEDVYDDLKKNPTDKLLLRTCQKVWKHM
ncbi:26622_t:CDS:2, partial [Gigaspora margarita]